MAFTYTKVNFLNNESYNEIKHSEALASGWPNFVVEGFDFDSAAMTLTNGRAMNGGLPVILGREGETQDVVNNGTDVYIVLKTVLRGVTSINTIEMRATKEVINEDTLKEFPLYRIDPTNGEMLEDYRHSAFIKTVEFEDLGDDTFRLVINGTWSPPFNVSVLQNAYSKSEADSRFERAVTINNDYTNEDFTDMNMAQIINFILTPFSGYGAGVVVGTANGTITLPALHTALVDLVSEFYGETLGAGSITLRFEVEGRNLNCGAVLQVAVNDGATYMFTYDNYGTDFATVNADAFRRQIKHVGQLIQEDKWDTVQKREVVMYDGGRSFIESGQTVTLHKGGYLTMASFEKITLLFERFDTDAYETLGYGYKQVHQQNFTIANDGFYGKNTEIFPLSFAVDNPNTPVKAWQINSSGILTGHSLNSKTNRGYVLVAVIGHVAESAFKGVDATTRKTKGVQIKTIPVSKISPDAKEVIMADGANAYDIYDMDTKQIVALKTKLGIESEE